MLIMCLTRLHLGLAVVDLTNRFQICKTTVSKVFFISVRCEKNAKMFFFIKLIISQCINLQVYWDILSGNNFKVWFFLLYLSVKTFPFWFRGRVDLTTDHVDLSLLRLLTKFNCTTLGMTISKIAWVIFSWQHFCKRAYKTGKLSYKKS